MQLADDIFFNQIHQKLCHVRLDPLFVFSLVFQHIYSWISCMVVLYCPVTLIRTTHALGLDLYL